MVVVLLVEIKPTPVFHIETDHTKTKPVNPQVHKSLLCVPVFVFVIF